MLSVATTLHEGDICFDFLAFLTENVGRDEYIKCVVHSAFDVLFIFRLSSPRSKSISQPQ